ncbi:MAG: CDP-diacylglycerol--serine O-phosphatidyltransferase [Deltaproteobacteria bacterium]|nr:CDP-diacylglycerol--serine O-phosphatidyltransferase [Deltaproteobacteria bacterium]
MKWHKLMFVLPNAFTVSSIFCGFYAITLCAAPNPGPQQFYSAALAIFFAIFFDGFDGRVARLTRTQSDFGVELDSLADVISFGVAPALLVYKWALSPLGFAGLVISFAFATCGALRLARFNVMAQRKVPGSSKFFTGLPIPLAAGMLISLVIAYHHAGLSTVQAHVPIAVLVGGLSLLMVSGVRYRTFKDVRLSRRSAMVFFAVVLAGVAVATQMQPSFVLVAYFSAYLLLGLAEEVVFFKRRREEARATRSAAGSAASSSRAKDDEDEDEEEEYV